MTVTGLGAGRASPVRGELNTDPEEENDGETIMITMLSISECLLGAKSYFDCFRCIN